jgi:predicted esterase
MTKYLFILLFAFSARAEDRPTIFDYEKLGPIKAIRLNHRESAPTIVFIHGYGGIGFTQYEELASTIEKNPILRQYNWIFPDNPGFSVTKEDFDLWQREMVQTRKQYDQMLKAAKVDPADVIWGGFSMGAFTAIDYTVHSKVAPKGLIVSGGFYYDSKDWKRKSGLLNGVPFYQSHDPKQDLFDFDEAKKIEKLLTENGMVGKIQKTSVGHKIPPGFILKAVRGISETSGLPDCYGPLSQVRGANASKTRP